jgi:hypothetical protein
MMTERAQVLTHLFTERMATGDRFFDPRDGRKLTTVNEILEVLLVTKEVHASTPAAKDLKITTFVVGDDLWRASGVTLLHVPTGTEVTASRSQSVLTNKVEALDELRRKLKQQGWTDRVSIREEVSQFLEERLKQGPGILGIPESVLSPVEKIRPPLPAGMTEEEALRRLRGPIPPPVIQSGASDMFNPQKVIEEAHQVCDDIEERFKAERDAAVAEVLALRAALEQTNRTMSAVKLPDPSPVVRRVLAEAAHGRSFLGIHAHDCEHRAGDPEHCTCTLKTLDKRS